MQGRVDEMYTHTDWTSRRTEREAMHAAITHKKRKEKRRKKRTGFHEESPTPRVKIYMHSYRLRSIRSCLYELECHTVRHLKNHVFEEADKGQRRLACWKYTRTQTGAKKHCQWSRAVFILWFRFVTLFFSLYRATARKATSCRYFVSNCIGMSTLVCATRILVSFSLSIQTPSPPFSLPRSLSSACRLLIRWIIYRWLLVAHSRVARRVTLINISVTLL